MLYYWIYYRSSSKFNPGYLLFILFLLLFFSLRLILIPHFLSILRFIRQQRAQFGLFPPRDRDMTDGIILRSLRTDEGRKSRLIGYRWCYEGDGILGIMTETLFFSFSFSVFLSFFSS
ncbi:hypothetical protein P167DRAFT_267400 [Morchella conica CCBAS932]|uniref:Uncharacterized protein n=1 Tax=Morchella conica CCBAS932 TaxID=1392247 RepID=A0A3N4L5D4_9PEZI|nr:hypothetical protein P167DRAFT_267400 [Morchella conica CCBAS932]